MNKLFYILLSFALLLVACKKGEELVIDNTQTANSPVFYVNGSFRGRTINYVAGDDDRFMFSNTYNRNNLNVFQGELKPDFCSTSCSTSLEILLSSYQNDSTSNNFDPNFLFFSGYSPTYYLAPGSPYDFAFGDTSSVIVNYTDVNGQLLSSGSSQLNMFSSFFEIDSVTDYELNSNNQKTKRVVFKLLCYLADSNGSVNDSISLSGAFAFAYP